MFETITSFAKYCASFVIGSSDDDKKEAAKEESPAKTPKASTSKKRSSASKEDKTSASPAKKPRKTPAKKTPAKKTPAKKTPAKTPSSRKRTPAKKKDADPATANMSSYDKMKHEKWMKNFLLLKEYKKKFGHLDIPYDEKFQDFGIGRWVARQRTQYALREEGDPNAQMTDLQAKLLEEEMGVEEDDE